MGLADLDIPMDFDVLRLCRCCDCRHHWVDLAWSPAGDAHRCNELIGGSSVVWATGTLVTQPAVDAWHYCTGYAGPAIRADVWLVSVPAPQTAIPPAATQAREGVRLAPGPSNGAITAPRSTEGLFEAPRACQPRLATVY